MGRLVSCEVAHLWHIQEFDLTLGKNVAINSNPSNLHNRVMYLLYDTNCEKLQSAFQNIHKITSFARPLNQSGLYSVAGLYFTTVHATGAAMKDWYIIGHMICPISKFLVVAAPF